MKTAYFVVESSGGLFKRRNKMTMGTGSDAENEAGIKEWKPLETKVGY